MENNNQNNADYNANYTNQQNVNYQQPQMQQQPPQYNGGYVQPPVQQQKPKKPIYKKWWFWVIIVIVLLGIIGSANSKDDENGSTTTSSVTSISEEAETTQVTTEKETTTEKTTESTTKGMSAKEYKNSCEAIPYKSIARDPDKYEGKHVKFTGEVIQVVESSWGNSVDYRISVKKESWGYSSDEVVYVTYTPKEGESRILEDDIVTFYGESKGLISYESTLGGKITIPQVEAEYIVLNE